MKSVLDLPRPFNSDPKTHTLCSVLIDSSQSISPAGFNWTNSRRKKTGTILSKIFYIKENPCFLFLPSLCSSSPWDAKSKTNFAVCYIIPFLNWSVSQSHLFFVIQYLHFWTKRLVFREYTEVIDILSWYIIYIYTFNIL